MTALGTNSENLVPPMPDELTAVQRVLEVGNTQLGDYLSDTYKELWDIATQPDAEVKSRTVSPADVEFCQKNGIADCSQESELLALLRQGRVVRRLAILASFDDYVQTQLKYADAGTAADLAGLYKTVIEQIMEVSGIEADAVDARVQVLQKAQRFKA